MNTYNKTKSFYEDRGKMIDNYYKPPKDKIFDEIKREAIKIWQTYDNTYGYVDEKVNRIKDIGNVQDNAMFIVAMFDLDNQRRLLENLSKEARVFITDRVRYTFI